MKKLTTLIALAAIAGSASAATIVDYDPIVAGGGWDAPAADWDVATTTTVTRNFDTTTPMYSSGGIYGGGSSENRLISDGSLGTANTASYRMIRADPDGELYNTVTDATHYNNVNVAYLFKKADFVGSPSSVAFEAASTLSVNISKWYDRSWNPNALDAEVRHIVKQSGQDADKYWVSEATANLVDDLAGGVIGTFTLTDFNNNSTAGKRWTEISLTSTDFGIGTKLDAVTWQAVDFTDVEAVGIVGEGSKDYSGNFAFDNYTATAIPEPATLGLIATFGVSVLFIRRRLMM